MIAQWLSLERRTGRGRDAVDHAPGRHDDLANAVAGALVAAAGAVTRGPIDRWIHDANAAAGSPTALTERAFYGSGPAARAADPFAEGVGTRPGGVAVAGGSSLGGLAFGRDEGVGTLGRRAFGR